MLVLALVFVYYFAVGVILYYMNISSFSKIIALSLPSFFAGSAVTLLVLDIRYGTHLRWHKKHKQRVEAHADNADDVR